MGDRGTSGVITNDSETFRLHNLKRLIGIQRDITNLKVGSRNFSNRSIGCLKIKCLVFLSKIHYHCSGTCNEMLQPGRADRHTERHNEP